MTMRKVIALCSIQRHPVDGERVLLKAGTPFEIEKGSEEEAQLESMNAIRDAKESDIVKAQEAGLAPIKRPPRFRTRREIRAIEDAERDLANRGVRRSQSKPLPTSASSDEADADADEGNGGADGSGEQSSAPASKGKGGKGKSRSSLV